MTLLTLKDIEVPLVRLELVLTVMYRILFTFIPGLSATMYHSHKLYEMGNLNISVSHALRLEANITNNVIYLHS